ncbi:hypothetical protein GCM10022419_112150 [Nonomuraea rosea]|uniref:Uncharacterized protein n=1 Tax=Nonomuraea rosea TaxID=638574 RepID=A0ABP6ZK87_9ACTN
MPSSGRPGRSARDAAVFPGDLTGIRPDERFDPLVRPDPGRVWDGGFGALVAITPVVGWPTYRSRALVPASGVHQEHRGRVFELPQGQPWLVNALAYEITFKMGASGIITAAQVDEANAPSTWTPS